MTCKKYLRELEKTWKKLEDLVRSRVDLNEIERTQKEHKIT